MKPILYPKNETSFTSKGLGTLTDALSCIVTEERNNTFELEMTYPADGIHVEDLSISKIILAIPSDGATSQPFRIYMITTPMDGVLSIKAEHVFYQHDQIPVAPFSATTATNALAGIKTNSLVTNPFTYSTDVSVTNQFEQTIPKTAREYLGSADGSILSVFGGEFEFNRYNVTLHASRGSNSGVTLRYGKNITDIQQEVNLANTVTGILPYWSGQLTDDVTKEQYVYNVIGDVIYGANADQFPEQRIVMEDVSSYFEAEQSETIMTETGRVVNTIEVEVPTKAQVNEFGRQILATKDYVCIPKVSIDVSFVDLAQTEEYKNIAPLEHVKLCDTVTVYFEALGIETSAKVVKTEYDVLKERYEKITLGNPQETLASVVIEQQRFMGKVIERENITKTRFEVLDGRIEGEVYNRTNDDDVLTNFFTMDASTLEAALASRYGTTNSFATNIKVTAQGLTSEVSAREDADSLLSSAIRQSAHKISLTTTSGTASAGITIVLKDADGNEIGTPVTGTITMNGIVTFTNYNDQENPYATGTDVSNAETRAAADATSKANAAESNAETYAYNQAVAQASSYSTSAKNAVLNALANGTTTVNGGCITTGTLNAAYVNVINLSASSITSGSLSSNSYISIGALYDNVTLKNNIVYSTYFRGLRTPSSATEVGGAYLESYDGSASVAVYKTSGGGARIDLTGSLYSENTADSTTSSAANVFINSGSHYGHFGRSTASSARYKHDITKDIKEDLDPRNLLEVSVCQYKYKTDYLGNKNDQRYDTDVIGFIAEDISEKYPIACEYDDKGRAEDWNARFIIPPMLAIIQEQEERISSLESRIDKLEELINKLSRR